MIRNSKKDRQHNDQKD